MAFRDELARVLTAAGTRVPAGFADDTSLIRSGLVESTVLFELSLWVEERIGRELDLRSFDLVEEWDTPAGLEDFIRRARDDGSR